ncbi:unnamed protein product [Ceutorhynchus assimilis]|uniref:Malate dehydrogenase, mitochondrial n=1 Tax=Ceutorhynchus assimilis TaxID=467358 RepID=A0A9N9MD55_9CUCU|nr:unnamed protein product [Ceutorhynchus assimilis]
MFSKLTVNQLPKIWCLFNQRNFGMAPCTYNQNAIKTHFTVTLLEAADKMGRQVALLLKQSPLISELRLYDKNSSVCVVAEDLSHIDTYTKVKSYCGMSVLKHAVQGADIVVSVGGCRSQLKECSKELFEKNLDDIRSAIMHCMEFNPKAIFCIAKPPIEAFVPMAAEEYKKAGVFDPRKIIGITSVGCMRANYFIGLISGQNPADVQCPIVGGISKNCLVACVSQSRPGKVHPQHYKMIQDSISIAEDEVLKSSGDGMTCLSSALGVAKFVNAQCKALSGVTNCVDCAFVKQTGHVCQFLPYMASIVRLGRHGVLSCHMPKINGYEAHCLKRACMYIKENIKLGESFVTGDHKKDSKKTAAPVKLAT